MELNSRQKNAVESTHSNVAVVAGPGTGKSKVLLYRAVELMTRCSKPSDVVLCSFTNASVNDLRKTLDEGQDYVSARLARTTTFHSLSLRSLLKMKAGPPQVFIADDWEETELIDSYLKRELKLSRITAARKRRRDFDARWCQAKEDPTDWLNMEDRRTFLDAWDRVKAALEFLTRSELTYRWWQRLSNEPAASNEDLGIDFKYLLVDEYQDLNECEHGILEILSGRGCEVFVVGDPNQSIYEGLRHAHPELCASFQGRFSDSEEIVLDETYRCPDAVLKAATALMANDSGLRGVPTKSHRDTSGYFDLVNYPTETAEASGIAQSARLLLASLPATRILVLVPARQVADIIATELTALNVDFRTTFRPRPAHDEQAKKAEAIARLIGNSQDSLAAATLILLCGAGGKREQNIYELVNKCSGEGFTAAGLLIASLPSGLSQSLVKAIGLARKLLEEFKSLPLEEAIARLQNDFGGIDLEHYLLPAQERKRLEEDSGEVLSEDEEVPSSAPPGVTLTTYHSSKGLEADYVFAAAVEPPFFEDDSRASTGEKRRLLFVGITRALTMTAVSYASRRYGTSGYISQSGGSRRGPSDLVTQIGEQLGTTPSTGSDFVKVWGRRTKA